MASSHSSQEDVGFHPTSLWWRCGNQAFSAPVVKKVNWYNHYGEQFDNSPKARCLLLQTGNFTHGIH